MKFRNNRVMQSGLYGAGLSVMVILLTAVYVAPGRTSSPESVPRQELWARVETAIQNGLPRTALEYIEPIIDSAIADRAYAEAISAVGHKLALEGEIQGNKPEEKIVMLETKINDLPEPMRPVLQAVLAHWYWHYFQNNRWRFMNRTQTAEVPGDDLTTWDLARIFAEIDHRFVAALENYELLRSTPVEDYDILLEKGTMDDRYRPTLYDFVAAEALHFYASGEQAAALPQDPFILTADSPVFASLDQFLKWEIETADADSPVYRGVRLLQEVLRFHADQDYPDALLDWELRRLRFGYNLAAGEEKDGRYQAALRRFIDRHDEHEISARARFALGSILKQQGELVEAREQALRGYRRFPDSPGGRQCYNLVQEIEEPAATLKTERVWHRPGAEIAVEYKNITAVHFRLIPWDWQEELREYPDRHPEQISYQTRSMNSILQTTPSLEWSRELPATEDYRMRTDILSAPVQIIEPGFYWLAAGRYADFENTRNVIFMAPIWVSDLALIMRSGQSGDQDRFLEGLVVDAESGEPVAAAQVQAWALAQPWREFELEKLEPGETDVNGLFRIPANSGRQHVLMVKTDGQRLAGGQLYTPSGRRLNESDFQRTVIFTDRSIYRPGQTVHYKGICIDVRQGEDRYQVIPDRQVRVSFLDVNGKMIESHTVRSNDYGSISGSFTAPSDRLLGTMSIRTGSPNGHAGLRVEEYKRPVFQVSLAAPETAPRLNDRVVLTGRATAYTGAPVDGARVRWRVVREVRYAPWWRRRLWWQPPSSGSQEIAHGVTATEIDGRFEIEFTARSAPEATEAGDPTFTYTVYADVTDAAGETRSATRRINVGFTALKADLSTPEWLVAEESFELAIRTTTLDGEGQSAAGLIRIYSLKSPDNVQPAPLEQHRPFPLPGPGPDGAAGLPIAYFNSETWPLDKVAAEYEFATTPGGHDSTDFILPSGAYRVILETVDRFGKTVKSELPLRVLDPEADSMAIKEPHLFSAPAWSLEPGETFKALWGSGYDQARAFVEIEHRGGIIESYWTDPAKTQALIVREVTEEMRGGFTVRVTMVRQNRAYIEQHRIEVPWSSKELDISWERFVSKLEPGQREIWTAVIRGPDAERATAEMVAVLYDKSLDLFSPHSWQDSFNVFRRDHSAVRSSFQNMVQPLRHTRGSWPRLRRTVRITYRSFPRRIISQLWGYRSYYYLSDNGYIGSSRFRSEFMLDADVPAPAARMAVAEMAELSAEAYASGGVAPEEAQAVAEQDAEPIEPMPDVGLDQVEARRDFNETAFFYPHLTAMENGEVRIQFTMPEALTGWRFMGFAHDRELRAGRLVDSVVTAKDLMVQPNPPRFLREGDTLEFTVRVTNQSAARQTGVVRLNFEDARTGDSFDQALANDQTQQRFDVPARESRTYSWRIEVPEDPRILLYRAVGSTGRLADGEEGYLPILSRRIMVTESLPLPIRGPDRRVFNFTKLLESGASDTLESKSLTVQMTSNPAWYAVMALPYLMEYPHRASEQVFNRLYANSLARYIANSDPRIRRVFEQWKGTDALDSPLTKNEDLKGLALEEMPWLRQALTESQARRNVGILFDDNRLAEETRRSLHQLTQMQLADGSWPWFPGGLPNDYITLYITTGFGRLRQLGVDVDIAPAVRALNRLDNWMEQRYRTILSRSDPEKYVPSPHIALYLYGRTFFSDDQPVADRHQEALNFFIERARDNWLRVSSRQSQGHLALALHRFGKRDDARRIMRSIKERSVTDEELGRFWRDLEISWWWYRAPIETQALMIEAFDEIMNDIEAVEECRIWLLKQKQTQDWKTTKATADAVYALLLRGADWLASDAIVEVSLGDRKIEPPKTEAGTGFYEQSFFGSEIEPAMGEVTVVKADEGIAWGGLHWQYLEDIAGITPHEETPLTLQKAIYTREATERGPQLKTVDGPLTVGDELVVRLVLRTDRDMEYVHLKDYRGCGTEPVNVISRYKYQDGLRYYESTRDTASHFFIDYLPKGTYVFEYSVRIQHRGRYDTGIASIQCMYAPEFNSHSQSFELTVE